MVRFLKTLALAAVLVAAAHLPAAAEKSLGNPGGNPQGTPGGTPLTVVELFTSQGCSSCPPADAFLGELAKRDDLLALSVHVDYWDYIGWKDPFASASPAGGRRAYAPSRRQGYVYAPNMVIQGAYQGTGSDRAKVLASIEKAAKAKRVPVTIERKRGKIQVAIPAAHTTDEAAVWLALFDRRHETAIRRGENGGRTLRYYNVVRKMVRIGTWTGQEMKIPAGITSEMAAGRDGCGVILQSLKTGRILGAAKIDLTGS